MAGRVGLTVAAEDVVALRKKMLVTPKEDVRSCRWTSSRSRCQRQEGRKKRQRSGSQLEATVAATGERCWEGKERLAGDQIRRQHDRDDYCGRGGRGWTTMAEAVAGWGESSSIVAVLHGRGGVERPPKEEEEQP
ncbi:hypothetical protein BHM03_00005025 [Ensete ventricosum]|nr:hypothetical protein BHM03_00005025 [Ensete ventricosum]